MTNTLIRVSYDGTNYSGFQIQDNAPTVQGALEKALAVIYKLPVRVTGAGRTDSGVHARGQAVNFSAPFQIAYDKLPHAINAVLPPDIVVTSAEKVAAKFHARFDACRKIYSYTLDRADFPQVTRRLYSWHMPDPLRIEKIYDAAGLFEGTHDFKAFQAAGGRVSDTTRTLYRIEIKEITEEKLLVLCFEGSGFLYHMVRLITGTLIRAGKGRITTSEIGAGILGINPAAVGPTAPAHGLCLEQVLYDKDNRNNL
jgi:tRNA pseudouridine38-40 synthase